MCNQLLRNKTFCLSVLRQLSVQGEIRDLRKLPSKTDLATLLLVSLMAVSCLLLVNDSDVSSADPAGSPCGENVTYSIVEGKLVISGTGPMYDYSLENPAPWRNSSFAGIEIGDGITHIGAYSFYYSSKAVRISLPDSVTSIGDCAFYCSYLSEISFSSNLTTIGYGAFANCSSLGNIEIPSKVTSVGDAFCGCSSMTAISVSSSNNCYCSVDGVLFNKAKTTLIQYPAGKYGAYTIPDGVKTIGANAFYYCSNLTSLTIPDSLTTLTERFTSCSSLTSVSFGNGLINVGPNVFDEYSFRDSDGTSLEKTASNLKGNVFVKDSSAKILTKYARVNYVLDGQVVFTDLCAISSNAELRDKYQKTGYTVTDWNTSDVSVNEGHFTVDRTKIVFRATSTINQYDVNYHVVNTETGLTETATHRFNYGTVVTVEPTFVKSGYTVTPWATTDAVVENGKFTLGAEAVNFNASATANTYGYTVNYLDAAGKAIADPSTGQGKCDTDFTPPIPQITGYTAPGQTQTKTISWDEPKNVVNYVYAVNTYHVYYKVDGVTEFDDLYDYATQVTIRDAYTKTGYTVGPWQTESGISIVDGKFVLGAENVTFTCATQVNAYGYTVNYKDTSGKMIANTVTGTSNYGTTVDAPITLIEGYSSPTIVQQITVTENPLANVVDYIYPIISYVLTFDDGTVQTQRTYTIENKSVDIPAITEKRGYSASWEPFEYDLSDKTVEAVYLINEYRVTFEFDDAVYETYLLEFGKDIVLPVQNPVKNDTEHSRYSFIGWEGYVSGMKISDADMVFNALFDETVIPSQSPDKTYDVSVDKDYASFSPEIVADIVQQAILDSSVSMEVSLGDIKVSFDNAALRSLDNDRADLSVKSVDESQLSQSVKDIVGNRPVYDISFGNNKDFGTGKVSVTLPFVPEPRMDTNHLVIYYIAYGKVLEQIPCTYQDGHVTFVTNHFSTYAVMYDEPAAGSEFPALYVAIGVVAVIALAGGAFIVMKRRA